MFTVERYKTIPTRFVGGDILNMFAGDAKYHYAF